MRDALNFDMLPIVQDNMNYISFDAGIRTLTSISSNGYYGYQPIPLEKPKEDPQGDAMDVQFENYPQQQTRLVNNRKRGWQFSNDFHEFKKRRQNEKIGDNTKKKKHGSPHHLDTDLIEEMLKETHGCSLYHWNNKETDL